jgi:uncharacterized Zn finger protein
MDRNAKIALFKQVTWAEIEDWAGDKIAGRGQSYQRGHQVQDLAQTADGAAVAWVQGTHR